MSRQSTGQPSGRAVAGLQSDSPHRVALATPPPDGVEHLHCRISRRRVRNVRAPTGAGRHAGRTSAHHRADRWRDGAVFGLQPVPANRGDACVHYGWIARTNPALVHLYAVGVACIGWAQSCLRRSPELARKPRRRRSMPACWSASAWATLSVRRARASFCPSASTGKATRSRRRAARAGPGISGARERWLAEARQPGV